MPNDNCQVTNLLRRPHALALTDATPPIDKIHQIRKNANNVICMSFQIYNLQQFVDIVYFMTSSTIANSLCVGAPYKYFHIRSASVCRAAQVC